MNQQQTQDLVIDVESEHIGLCSPAQQILLKLLSGCCDYRYTDSCPLLKVRWSMELQKSVVWYNESYFLLYHG